MENYITRQELEKILKAMTILDVVMVDKEEAWLRRTSVQILENETRYQLSNGSGDHVTVIFTPNGALIKGFDHESGWNQFAADEWDNEFFESIYANLPDEFAKLLDEDDRDNTTFCMWCMDDTDVWTQNEMQDEEDEEEDEEEDGGKEYLLLFICQNAAVWCEWAKYYYEMPLTEEIIQKVYAGEFLTEEDVKKLNPERDAKEVFAELAELLRADID